MGLLMLGMQSFKQLLIEKIHHLHTFMHDDVYSYKNYVNWFKSLTRN